MKIPQQTQRGQSPEGQSRPSEVRALRARQDPAWSKAQRGQRPRGPDKTQRGQRPRGPDKTQRGQRRARQTRRGQRPKGPGGHRRCGVAFLTHRAVNPGGRDAPGSKPQTEPVQLVVFPGWSGPLAVFCVPFTGPVRSGLGRSHV